MCIPAGTPKRERCCCMLVDATDHLWPGAPLLCRPARHLLAVAPERLQLQRCGGTQLGRCAGIGGTAGGARLGCHAGGSGGCHHALCRGCWRGAGTDRLPRKAGHALHCAAPCMAGCARGAGSLSASSTTCPHFPPCLHICAADPRPGARLLLLRRSKHKQVPHRCGGRPCTGVWKQHSLERQLHWWL